MVVDDKFDCTNKRGYRMYKWLNQYQFKSELINSMTSAECSHDAARLFYALVFYLSSVN